MSRALFALLLLASGCGPKKLDDRPGLDADAKSGPDGKRSGAIAIAVNRLSPPDEVSFDKQDMTDWKSVALKGPPGLLTVELRWDDDRSDMNIDLFDGAGQPIGNSPGPLPGAQAKKVAAQIDQPGIYYLRVTAPKAHDGSIYTLIAHWFEGHALTTQATVESPTIAVSPDGGAPPIAADSAPSSYDDGGGVEGRMVEVYREGEATFLNLDKGSSAGVQVGQTGAILDGRSGEDALPGGSFVITKVVSATRSIAKTSLVSVGRNSRVVIHTH